MASTIKIASRQNQRLVDLRRIRDGRDESKIFIEGRRLVAEAVRSGLAIDDCFVSEGFAGAELVRELGQRASLIAVIPNQLFGSIAETRSPQGIIVTARRPVSSKENLEEHLGKTKVPVVLLLNEIGNPSNLGAIIRTAEAADAVGVVVSRNSADAFSPKALRAAMGSAFRLPIWSDVDLETVFAWASECGLTVTATDASARTVHFKTDWRIPRILIFGSEAHGLRESPLPEAAERVSVPMSNGVESLNLAVSTGVILFEARRQND